MELYLVCAACRNKIPIARVELKRGDHILPPKVVVKGDCPQCREPYELELGKEMK